MLHIFDVRGLKTNVYKLFQPNNSLNYSNILLTSFQ